MRKTTTTQVEGRRIPAQPGPRGVPLGMLVPPTQPAPMDTTAQQPGPEDVMANPAPADEAVAVAAAAKTPASAGSALPTLGGPTAPAAVAAPDPVVAGEAGHGVAAKTPAETGSALPTVGGPATPAAVAASEARRPVAKASAEVGSVVSAVGGPAVPAAVAAGEAGHAAAKASVEAGSVVSAVDATVVPTSAATPDPSAASEAGPAAAKASAEAGSVPSTDAASGAVIPGAGPANPSGERATVRLRDVGPDDPPRYAPEWLELREGADAAARAPELLDPLRIRLANLPGRSGVVIHDLGCGTGSMGRWLAPRLDGAQHWILHDRDPYLLHFAAVASPRAAADGSRVTVETRRGDVARLTPDALVGASLVTASALLDVLTREEVDALVAACVGAGCPALLTLSVAGRVELTPSDPMDAEIADAFNAHQRRDGLLGPDAVTVTCEAFAAHGATVRVHPSTWRLGPDHLALTAEWLRGWVGAAVEERPELKERADRYLARRLAACAAGELTVLVHHSDLLALARPTGGTS